MVSGVSSPEPSETCALIRAFPAVATIPRARCTELPTAVQRLERLGAHVGANGLWIKRDDQTGTLYGGNKPRKLDFLLGDVLARRKTSVMTFGGIGTNHGLATAIYARALDLRAILVLLGQPVTQKVRRNLLLCAAAGAELHYAPGPVGVATAALLRCGRSLLEGALPAIVPTGGTSPLGVLGYVNAAFELRDQVAAGLLPSPDWIFVATGSGGTLAGLQLGCRLAGLPARVVGVLVTDILPPSPARIASQANRAHALLARTVPSLPAVRIDADDVRLVTGFLGPGYGAPTDQARAMRRALEDLEGIPAETTYTGKCLAALQAVVQEASYRDATILYWHTYSSVDPADYLPPLPDFRDLPEKFHQFFRGPAVPD